MANSNKDVEQRIRDFVSKNLLFSADGFSYSDDASFLQEGIIDSLGVMQLVEFLQQDFCVPVEQQEVTPENFDSVTRLAGFVRRKIEIRNRPVVEANPQRDND